MPNTTTEDGLKSHPQGKKVAKPDWTQVSKNRILNCTNCKSRKCYTNPFATCYECRKRFCFSCIFGGQWKKGQENEPIKDICDKCKAEYAYQTI